MHSPPTGETAWSSDALYYHLSKENELKREKGNLERNDMLYLEATIYNNKLNKIELKSRESNRFVSIV